VACDFTQRLAGARVDPAERDTRIRQEGIIEAVVENELETVWPKPRIAAKQIMMIIANITAYSTEVGPSSLRRNPRTAVRNVRIDDFPGCVMQVQSRSDHSDGAGLFET